MNDCSQPREEAPGDAIAGHVREILRLMGEDPSREGLLKTPERVQKAFQFLLQGCVISIEIRTCLVSR